MKKIIILTAFILSTALCSNIFGQQTPPPGAGDKNLGDNNVKTRSIDLERVDRDAKKNSQPGTSSIAGKETEDQLGARFGEIKTDFEQIQLSQDKIIKAYQGNGKIDYAQIGKSALEINKSAMRLDANLFQAADNPDDQKDVKKENQQKEETKPAKSIRDLIVNLDNAIRGFAASSMFQNLRLIDPKVAIKTRLDLKKITGLSIDLMTEAQRSAGK